MSARDPHPADTNPIVISAMAGMFPGAPDIDAYWQRIRAAEVAPLTELGPRWGVAADRYLAAQPGVPDRTYVDQAYCLPDDAGAEASSLSDRQARVGQAVLQQLLRELPGSRPQNLGFVLATEWTGGNWFERAASEGMQGIPELDLPPPPALGYAPDGQLQAIADGLIPPGAPRIAVDTACASSLYGIDLGRRLLLSGRADAVAVMGLTAWLPLFLLTSFSQLMALSPERRLLPYAANASGIMLGEACGVLLMEPLAKALAAGRPVLAVLRRQGLSADGADRSVFAPGRDGQRLMYQRAYADLPADLDYLEGHGTATKLGDETELAIMREFYAGSAPGSLPIGSVKGLIGHTLAAAGICSTIKALLMLRAKELPPHNAVEANENIAGSPLKLLTAPTPWAERADRPRRIGVSSFGFGGANAHIVLEEYRADTHLPAFVPLAAQPLAIVDAAQSAGDRLPDTLTIDAQGLRMGPNFLKRLDPYQLLITDLAHRIADRQPELANDENAGVVMGSNLGGALTLKLMRRATWLTRHQPGTKGATARADRFGPKHSLESIASCLPNMCSGYPAFHFNLRGFHQTLSGSAGLFWESLALAPSWLADGCDRLLLGAGRMNKWSQEKATEGAALFLLQPAAAASRPPLAIIHAIVPGDVAPDFASACAVAGLPPEQFDWHGISALDESAWAEAAGSEILFEALQATKQWAAIEVRDGERRAFTILLEKKQAPVRGAATPSLPVNVPVRESAAPAITATPGIHAAPAAAAAAGSVSPALARQWVASTSSALHSFFAAQRATMTLLGQPGAAALPLATQPGMNTAGPIRSLRRSDAHRVIADMQATGDGKLSAALLIDEVHPYFFDHPLDHVPGILMLEGLLQLAEWQAGDSAWIRHIKLSFRRFCEKEAPVRITMAPRATGQYEGSVEQSGHVACRFDLGLAPRSASLPVAASEPQRQRPDLKLLHKHRAENVLVTPLFDAGNGLKACETFSPPAGHVLAEGDPQHYGMLYLLETTRQFVMLIAHTVWEVPLGLPMNLLSIQLDLDRPAPRGLPVTISHKPTALGQHQESAIVVVETQLSSGGLPLGRATVVAQALTKEAYAQQRAQHAPATAGESS